jgi:hypothetical protein
MNMSREIREDLLPRLRERYVGRGREGRSRMLEELCADYGYERKYAIKLLRGECRRPPSQGIDNHHRVNKREQPGVNDNYPRCLFTVSQRG